MGNSPNLPELIIAENRNRDIFVELTSIKKAQNSYFGSYVLFAYCVRYKRFTWNISLRFNELISIDRRLQIEFPNNAQLKAMQRPEKFNKIMWLHDDKFLEKRGKIMLKYIQELLDIPGIFPKSKQLRRFLNLSDNSLSPDNGRKGMESFMVKSSGGYYEKFSRTSGDYFTLWRNRWIVITDTCISWYRTPEDRIPSGTLLIDQGFHFVVKNRIIVLFTETRKIVLQAATKRLADQWVEELNSFYTNSTRITPQPFGSFKAIRSNCHVKVYTAPRDYYSAVAVALLNAQKEILITGWKNSPCVVLTRPPLPTLRLDQILKYKAEQGVKIFILLYKEVEYVGQGNDSGLARAYLTSLHKNIHCIRHPNKFIGGSTAVLWSHHEKTVIIDRNLAFVGGIDLAYQRWDDEKHRAADEDGIIYPGKDYRQPAPALFKPARKIAVQKKNSKFEDEDDEMIIEHDSGSVSSPKSIKQDNDDNDLVEEFVDFGHSTPVKRDFSQSQDAHSPGAAISPSPGGLSAINEGGEEEEENLSEISKSHLEDRFMGDTEEEDAAKKDLNRAMKAKQLKKSGKQVHVESQDDDDDDLSLAESDRMADTRDGPRSGSFALTAKTKNSTASSLVSSGSYFYDNMMQGIINAKSSLLDSAEFVKQQIQSYKDAKGNLHASSSQIEIRDFYPRMGWHDVQAAVNGAPARDVASHFVQRWNHHRSSTSQLSEPILRDITDNFFFTSCARCKISGILETFVICPNCQYDLGPCNSYSTQSSPSLLPLPISEHSYILFEVSFGLTFPFKMGGDCPVIITNILESGGDLTLENIVSREIVGGLCKPRIVDIVGPYANHLVSETSSHGSFTAAVGDIVYKVDEVEVTHLDCLKVKRYLKRKVSERKKEMKMQTPVKPIVVTFRRHFLSQVFSDDKAKFSAEAQAPAVSDNPAVTETENDFHDSSSATGESPATTTDSHQEGKVSTLHPVLESALGSITTHSPTTDNAHTTDNKTSNDLHPAISPFLTLPTTVAFQQSGNKITDINHTICQAATQKEQLLNMSLLAHKYAATLDLVPRLFDGTGSLQVQVLRSVGKWSIGTKTECSIMNCWIETIRSAHHLVYIENQFFIGNLAGDDVVNGVPLAIADRVLQAHTQKQRFRVIVVIPMHPNGDFAGALKSKLVLHYEMMTICKGMFAMLKRKAPEINITDYITFHSLKSWGVINNKVVADQVYVHDKLLIVDDRICVIGSANINDRSMMGNRDSEMAIRIEDTVHETISLGSKPFIVGSLPHRVRLRLMHQHLADQTIDVVDILDDSVFFNNWRKISNANSTIYDELDGDTSMYRVTRIVDFYSALAKYENKSALDPHVMSSMKEIKGFLVDWPYTLLQNEDLSPTIATRAVIPNELWV